LPALSTNGPVNVVGQDAESGGIVHTGAYVGPDELRLDLVATLGGGAVTELAISPTFVRDRTYFAATMAGLFRSEDVGERWNRVGDPLAARPPAALATSPAYARDGTLLVADLEAGVYRVVGGHWTISDLAGYGVQVAALAATATGLFRSRNGGRAWRESTPLGDGTPVLCLALSPAFESDGIVLAGTDSAGLSRSADRRATWHPCDGFPGDACVDGVACSPAFAADAGAVAIAGSDVYVSYPGGGRWSPDAHVPDPLCLALALTAPATRLLLIGTTQGAIYRGPTHV